MTTDPFEDPDPEPMVDADQRWAWTADADATEQQRASRYLKALGDEEFARRKRINYVKQYSLWPDTRDGLKDPCTVERCPVCGNASFVAPFRDGVIDEIGIGHCIICSYERALEVAENAAEEIQYERARDRD